jgi:hypothetical protein
MSDSNYSAVGTCAVSFGNILTAPYTSPQTVNSIRVGTTAFSGTFFDMPTVSVQIIGN